MELPLSFFISVKAFFMGPFSWEPGDSRLFLKFGFYTGVFLNQRVDYNGGGTL